MKNLFDANKLFIRRSSSDARLKGIYFTINLYLEWLVLELLDDKQYFYYDFSARARAMQCEYLIVLFMLLRAHTL